MRALSWMVLTLWLLSGCQSHPVNTDYDTAEDFSRYRLYGWTEDSCRNDPLMCERLKKALREQFDQRQFKEVKNADADFLVRYWLHNVEDAAPDKARGGIALGGGSGGVGMGLSLGFPLGGNNDRQIEIVVEFVGPVDSKLKWQGARKGGVPVDGDPAAATAKIAAMVSEIIAAFPPARP